MGFYEGALVVKSSKLSNKSTDKAGAGWCNHGHSPYAHSLLLLFWAKAIQWR